MTPERILLVSLLYDERKPSVDVGVLLDDDVEGVGVDVYVGLSSGEKVCRPTHCRFGLCRAIREEERRTLE